MNISIIIYILIGLLIITLLWITRLERRLSRLLKGKKGGDLEDTIKTIHSDLQKVIQTQLRTDSHLKIIDEKLSKTVRRVEMTRFNPFGNSGNNQSFAIALISEEGDGVVLSSLYSRDRMSIFAKPIKKGDSEFDLSNEEKEVLKKAR
ncbi:MAG: DUF4446 family protein [Patescibacteria group bacterium]|nr:DUF4446 family protein [Patescibacteria group bacterium]